MNHMRREVSMAELRLKKIVDERPVKISVELPLPVYHDLVRYAELMSETDEKGVEPHKLVAPMVKAFMASDRGFAKAKRGTNQ